MNELIGHTLKNATKKLADSNIKYTVKYLDSRKNEDFDEEIVIRVNPSDNGIELLCGKFKRKIIGKGNSEV